MSSENPDFKKLIKEVGIRKAIEIMKAKGIVYSGDFTIDHRTDSFFSTPYDIENQKMNNINENEINIAFTGVRPSGNLYSQDFYSIDNPLTKIPYPNSIFDISELVIITDGYIESQETTSGILRSPESPTVNQ